MTSSPPPGPTDAATGDDPGERYLASLDERALEAVVEAMVLVGSADGTLSAVERQRLSDSVATLTSGRFSAAETGRRLERIEQRTAGMSRAARLASLAERLPDPTARRVALVLAADIAFADGVLHEAEVGLCMSLAAALGISPDEAAALGVAVTTAAPDAAEPL